MMRLSQMVLIGLFYLVSSSLYAQSGQIGGLLTKVTVHKGQTFELAWYADPGEEVVQVIDFVLNFDPQYISVTDVEREPASPLNAHQVETTIDADAGRIIFGIFKLLPPLPDSLFSFVKTQVVAKAETPNTELKHDLATFPYTLMAYAGKNTMERAEGVRVTVLPEINSQSSYAAIDSRPDFKVESGENEVSINFNVEKEGAVWLSLRNSDDVLIAELFEMTAAPGVNYEFGLNDSLLAPGIYVIELRDASGTRTRMLPLDN